MIERLLGRRAVSPRRMPTFLLLLVLLVGGGAGYAFHRYTASTVVHIESVNSPGAEPAFIPAVATTTEAVPQRPVHAVGHIVTGETEGLYGGTETTSCDAAAIQTFLDSHPQPAQAWAGALRFDSGLTDPLDAPARARWPLDPDAEKVRGAGVKA